VPFGGSEAMYDDHLKLTGKCIVDFLLNGVISTNAVIWFDS